jgi:heme exporter protein CcmD
MSPPEKFAEFVWAAYGVSALLFGWIVVATLFSARRWRRRAEKLEREARE